ncbi:hypothetical protein M406DRAFT_327533 [Cryphonectria parasitica EP155]|uniref:Uncharacterized protein n=1 Tax=Cryphonectria parasitica (strain ATCC 38755 / EP155) TaxID=660469 RepID=A0A9P5CSB2_CRYP1|nr:uncharacterized protein M406DRAFT_327533 [Cryphonectria parasitica EP155]KAF3769128.1 hypothetical protein M406DRAFT_327533 [Cryphonectria parasitica EP155]
MAQQLSSINIRSSKNRPGTSTTTNFQEQQAVRVAVDRVIDGLKAWDKQYSSNNIVRNLRLELAMNNEHTKHTILAITALVGGAAIPGKLWDYAGDTKAETKKWVTLLTELQGFLNWTKVERLRPASIKTIARKYIPTPRKTTAKVAANPKTPAATPVDPDHNSNPDHDDNPFEFTNLDVGESDHDDDNDSFV